MEKSVLRNSSSPFCESKVPPAGLDLSTPSSGLEPLYSPTLSDTRRDMMRLPDGSPRSSEEGERHESSVIMDLDEDAISPSMAPGSVYLHGVLIVSLVIDGHERLCLAQISNTLLRDYSYNEIHNRRVALGITCVQCTPVQLELLRRAGAMPVSSRRCGMITRREAERLVKSFLDEITPPKLPENFAFELFHRCGWGCRGSFIPTRYNSSRAKCIRCSYCGSFFSPNKFIFHCHRVEETGQDPATSEYRHPDAANFNAWRRHLFLADPHPSMDLVHAWEDVKAMFNGGNRKRIQSSTACSAPSVSNRRTSTNMTSMTSSVTPSLSCSTNNNGNKISYKFDQSNAKSNDEIDDDASEDYDKELDSPPDSKMIRISKTCDSDYLFKSSLSKHQERSRLSSSSGNDRRLTKETRNASSCMFPRHSGKPEGSVPALGMEQANIESAACRWNPSELLKPNWPMLQWARHLSMLQKSESLDIGKGAHSLLQNPSFIQPGLHNYPQVGLPTSPGLFSPPPFFPQGFNYYNSNSVMSLVPPMPSGFLPPGSFSPSDYSSLVSTSGELNRRHNTDNGDVEELDKQKHSIDSIIKDRHAVFR